MRTLFEQVKDFFDKSFFHHIVVSILAFFLGYFISWYKRNSFYLISWLRNVKLSFFRKSYILIWNDHGPDVSENIISLLKDKGLNYRFRIVNEPYKLLLFPLRPHKVKMIILIVSDVTKLSEDEKKRNLIQNYLIRYIRKGGILFGTHDLIYKRCRNQALQNAFGCEINNFQRISKPVEVYVDKDYSDHPLVRNLNTTFSLDDGEICWGDWSKDAKALIRTVPSYTDTKGQLEIHAPVLVIRHTGENGTLIWLNSGDKGEKLARSLSEPQSEIIQILYNSIQYSSESLNYYKENL